MSGRIEGRLMERGIELPEAPIPAANYVPWVKTGSLVFIAGQIPVWNGERRFLGRVGGDLTLEDGQAAARLVALNVLAQLRAACGGDLDRVVRAVRLGMFVQCTPEFGEHPMVANAASELLVDVFGEAGRHTRAAVGAPSLPFGVAVEIDAVFEVAG
jgi:enamine deaminase RidA (YjgF/YER057c/UK114 family)